MADTKDMNALLGCIFIALGAVFGLAVLAGYVGLIIGGS